MSCSPPHSSSSHDSLKPRLHGDPRGLPLPAGQGRLQPGFESTVLSCTDFESPSVLRVHTRTELGGRVISPAVKQTRHSPEGLLPRGVLSEPRGVTRPSGEAALVPSPTAAGLLAPTSRRHWSETPNTSETEGRPSEGHSRFLLICSLIRVHNG